MREQKIQKLQKPRARDFGIKIGKYKTGKYNAITDVEGVLVGHSTIIKGASGKSQKGIVRTGVTTILPNGGDVFYNRIVGGGYVLNGAGEVSGLTQMMEWGMIETPIFLTNTLSVGICSDSAVQYMTERYPEIGNTHDVVIPVVGECDDSWLNDITGNHIKKENIFEAIRNAKTGPVDEGNVGGGTGMITCDFKGGIGTSSRKLEMKDGGFTIGVLVMSNFGQMNELRVDGVPIGALLEKKYENLPKRIENYGSIIAVLATDAPLLPHQLNRLAKRMSLGVGRVGSMAAHGSGEIMLAFSTANTVPRETKKMIYKMKILMDRRINPLYQAAIEATEEAILNALFAAEDMEGAAGRKSIALPGKEVQELLNERKYFG